MKKPLSITSPAHAWALVIYMMLGFSGLGGVLNLNNESAVTKSMGEGVADVWSTTLMLIGFGLFAAAVAASRTMRPEVNLRVEMILCTALFFNLTFFLVKLLEVAQSRAFTTFVFTLIFILGAGGRAWQINHEMGLIKKARAHPTEADPVMGDPRDDERG
jgi:hypothetical protein